jgi:hypothetical protein
VVSERCLGLILSCPCIIFTKIRVGRTKAFAAVF